MKLDEICKEKALMKYKILVIDDDKSILRLVRNVLESKNFVVDTLTSIPDIDICHFIGYDFQHLLYSLHLKFYNLGNLLLGQRLEGNVVPHRGIVRSSRHSARP